MLWKVRPPRGKVGRLTVINVIYKSQIKVVITLPLIHFYCVNLKFIQECSRYTFFECEVGMSADCWTKSNINQQCKLILLFLSMMIFLWIERLGRIYCLWWFDKHLRYFLELKPPLQYETLLKCVTRRSMFKM